MTRARMTDAVGSDRLLADLRALGVRPGDTLMVHVSMRRIGPLGGGAQGLVEVIDRAVGAAGTVLVTLGALDAWSWVNEEPEARRTELLAGSPPFDAVTTPADPDVGVFAEVFRTTPGTQVSDHPEGRFGARARRPRSSPETSRGTTTPGRDPRSIASSRGAGGCCGWGRTTTTPW